MFKVREKSYRDLILERNILTIPIYQRHYVWGEAEWEDFFNDLLNILKYNYRPHYMGNLLFKKHQTDIIDGQQRLITISLFLLAYKKIAGTSISSTRLDAVLSSNLNVNDEDNIYQSILYNTYDEARPITNKESKHIASAYKFFQKRIIDENFLLHLHTDLNLIRVLKKIIFVDIEIINADASIYLIFETLNARGIELNISDLVKNHIIDKATNKEFVRREYQIIERNIDGDEFEKLFQSFYNSKNNKKKLLKEITVNINNDEDIRSFLSDLLEYANIYRALNDERDILWNGNGDIAKHIRYFRSYKDSYVFKIILIPAKKYMNHSNFLKTMKYLEALIFRYLVICQKDQEKLKLKFYEIAQKINNRDIRIFRDIKPHLNKFSIDNEEFQNSFSYRTIEYSDNYANPTVRYIMYRLENYLAREERYILDQSDASIEHIGSQSNTAIDNVFRLGNYTLLTQRHNERASNKSFVQKKEHIYNQSTFLLTIGSNKEMKSLVSYNEWSLLNIRDRQKRMAKIAAKVWKI